VLTQSTPSNLFNVKLNVILNVISLMSREASVISLMSREASVISLMSREARVISLMSIYVSPFHQPDSHIKYNYNSFYS